MTATTSRIDVVQLTALNLALQVFDGVATYQGLRMGVQEANPLLVLVFSYVGVGFGLLIFKAKACALVLLLHRLGSHPVVPPVLAFLAATYTLFSLLPWSAKFAAMLLS